MAEAEAELVDSSIKTATDFARLFYEALDKRRHTIGSFYDDCASHTWNGNAVAGKDAIVNFWSKLPVSETRYECIDVQPLSESSTQLVVVVSGYVKFTDNLPKVFFHNCILGQTSSAWKITRDSYRTMD